MNQKEIFISKLFLDPSDSLIGLSSLPLSAFSRPSLFHSFKTKTSSTASTIETREVLCFSQCCASHLQQLPSDRAFPVRERNKVDMECQSGCDTCLGSLPHQLRPPKQENILMKSAAGVTTDLTSAMWGFFVFNFVF